MKQVIFAVSLCIPDAGLHPLLELLAAHIAVRLPRLFPSHHLKNGTAAEYALIIFFILKHADQHVGVL